MPSAYNIAASKYSTCLNKTSTVRHNQLLDNSVFQYIVNLLILLLHWPERQCSTMSHQNVWEGEVEVGPQWLPGPQHMSHHVCPKNRYETWLSLKFNLMKSNVSKWFIKGSLVGETSVLRTFRMSKKELVKERVSQRKS